MLKQVAVIAAEDTRVTAKLLNHYGIAAKLTALHEHNENRAVPTLLALLAQGKAVALVSDAGTPGVSDPGARLASAARAAGYTVTPVPGASAAVAALSVAGMTAPQFLFYGFLPPRAADRRSALARLAAYPFTLVFFEAPHRIVDSVMDMRATLGGPRRVVIARELTKMFETIHACLLDDAADWLNAEDNRRKGEFVLIVEGAAPKAAGGEETQQTLEVLLSELPLKQAVALATKITGAKKNQLYDLALKMRGEHPA